MAAKYLGAALVAVDWNSHIQEFLANGSVPSAIEECNLRLAVWSSEFERIDKGNPALCFVRAMQIAGHHVAALASLGLYKPAAASMREVVEDALYYSYFRTHPSELATLVRDARYFVEKSEILEYHKLHTKDFTELQGRFNLIQNLNKWYSEISAVIHGQLPGGWIEYTSLSQIKHSAKLLDAVVEKFQSGEQLTHHLFLCSCGRNIWDYCSKSAKGKLAHGLPGSTKAALGIDSA